MMSPTVTCVDRVLPCAYNDYGDADMVKKRTDIQVLRDAQVTKSNELIQKTRYNLSVSEQRLLLFLIAKISPYDTELPEITFTISDFFRVIGVQYNGVNYIECKSIIQGLADKSFWITEGNHSRLCRWIADADVEHGGTITIKLHQKLEPYLLNLRKNFTSYELAYTLQFKSKYSTRLYEFCKSIKFNNLQESYTYKITPDELRDRLGVLHRNDKGEITGNDYPRYANFKQRVLTPAMSEINEQTDLTLELAEETKGRKVIMLVLKITIKEPIERMRLRDEIDRALDLAAGINPDQMQIDGF